MNFKHGFNGTPTYLSWVSMHQRCSNKNVVAFKNYGGRGILVCKRWNDFRNFLADMGEKPEQGMLERIDNNKGYTPSNCKWATRSEQMRNRRNTVFVTAGGETMCLTAWAEKTGLKMKTIRHRIRAGWNPEKAVSLPLVPQRLRRGRNRIKTDA